MMRKLVYRSKHLSEIKNDFERGIFLAVYQSSKQRLYRSLFVLILSVKHILRGLLFSWPLYLFAFAAYTVPNGFWLMILLVLPAVYVSWMILNRGILEDHDKLIKGYILSFPKVDNR